MTKKHYKESDLQIRCVRYFRVKYPAFARLLEHPKNEGCGDRVRGAIAKAEGVQAGVADLMLHVPSDYRELDGVIQEELYRVHSMAIELKDKKGRQSAEQKIFQRYFEASGGIYVVVRSFEDFCEKVDRHMDGVPHIIRNRIEELHADIERESIEAARAEYQKLIHKND